MKLLLSVLLKITSSFDFAKKFNDSLKSSLIIICLMAAGSMTAQWKLDFCEIAIEMEFSETNTIFDHNFRYRDITASMQGGYNASTSSSYARDAWYTFVAVGTYISYNNTGIDSGITDISLYSGSCESLEYQQSYEFVIGKRYYIRYTPDRTNGTYLNDNHNVTIRFSHEPDNIVNHTNQTCTESESILIETECSEIELYQNNFMDSGNNSEICDDSAEDVWYEFIAPTSGVVDIEGTNLLAELYSGDCNNLVYSQCIYYSNKLVNLNSGENYYLRITGGNGIYCFKEGSSTFLTNLTCDAASIINVGDSDILLHSSPFVPSQRCTQDVISEVSWYQFTAPNSGRVQLSFSGGSSFNSSGFIYAGNCNSLSETDCFLSLESNIINYLNPNETYYIKINRGSRTQFSIEELASLPNDDICEGATPLTLGTDYPSYSVNYTSDPAFCTSDQTIWYSFLAPSSGSVQFASNTSTIHRFYEGTCNDLNYIVNHKNLHGLIPGSIYYIAVKSNSFSGMFSVTEISNDNVFTNEVCSNAQPIVVNDMIILPTQAAVQEFVSADMGICEANKYDLWYSFTATSEAIYFDLTVANKQVFGGSCGALNEIEGIQHYIAGSGNEIMYTNLTIGDTYYIRAWQSLTSTSISFHRFILKEYNFAPNDNNECSNPTIIQLVDPFQIFSFGYDYTYSAVTPPSCNSDMSGYHDAWFKFTAETNGVVIDPRSYTSEEETIVVYSGDCGILTEEFCFKSETSSNIYIGSLTVGTDFYIRRIVPQQDPQWLDIAQALIENGTCDQARDIGEVTSNYGFKINSPNPQTQVGDPLFTGGLQNGNWYRFTAPEEGAVQILGGSSLLYGSDCTDFIQEVNSNKFESQLISVTPGEEYHIYINSEFEIRSVASIPNESDCTESSAITLSDDDNCNQLVYGTTVNAAESSGSFCGSSRVDAVFYNFTAEDDASHQISVSNAAASHKVAVYLDCTLSTPIACGVGSINALMQTGQYYIIAVYPSVPNVESSFDLCIHIPEISVTGSVGISTDNPQAKLDVNGGIRPGFTNNNLPGNMRWNGDLEVYDGTDWKSTTTWDHEATKAIDMGNRMIRNLQDPVLPTDAVTKSYVDNYPDSDNSVLNEIQTLSKSGNTVSLSSDGGSFTDDVDDADNDPTNEIETWSTLAGIPTDIADGDDVNDADNDPTNEIETWSTLSGIPADIADGDDVDDADNDPSNEIETWSTLAGIPTDIADGDDVDDADNDPTNEIETWSTLSGIPTDIADGDDVDDADNDPSNEIETWSTLAGIPTDIADGDDVDDADNDPTNEIETWSTLAGIPLDIADGDDVDDADASITNEKINSINLTNQELTINEGSSDYMVDLASIATPWSNDVNDIYINDKVGIGITDPQTELDIDGEVQISTNSSGSAFQLNLIENNSGFARLNFTNTSDKDITLAAIPSATPADSKLNFFIEDAGDVMTLTGAERVGINNNNPQSDLHIKHKDGPLNGGLRIENVDATSTNYWNMYISSSSDELRLYANNTKVGGFDFTSGAYTSVSDERMKSSIQPLHFEWSKFMLLNAANYSFLHDANKRQYLGLLAQEVQEIYPELVRYDEVEDTYRLDYSGTGVIAIKAVQELKNENEILKERVENLEKKLEELIKLMK